MDMLPFEQEPKVLDWLESIRKAGCTVHSARPLNLFHKRNGELLFGIIQADITDSQGIKLNDILFLRGHACIIIPRIINSKTGEQAFLMIYQRRIGNGRLNLEFPAGMLDRNINDPLQVACNELREETGLTVNPSGLIPLNNTLLYSSPGASDEGIYYYGCSVNVSDNDYAAFNGRRIDNTHENEHIQVTLRSFDQAVAETLSLQARLGLYLFMQHFPEKPQSPEA
jgi:8-oxo-dGTP pyrophosphatase MutT (NUDIX family)